MHGGLTRGFGYESREKRQEMSPGDPETARLGFRIAKTGGMMRRLLRTLLYSNATVSDSQDFLGGVLMCVLPLKRSKQHGKNNEWSNTNDDAVPASMNQVKGELSHLWERHRVNAFFFFCD